VHCRGEGRVTGVDLPVIVELAADEPAVSDFLLSLLVPQDVVEVAACVPPAAAANHAVQHRSTATPAATNDSDKLPPNGDLPQRPRATSPPRVRIEGVRGSNPLSSTQSYQFSGSPSFDLESVGSQVGSQAVAWRGGATLCDPG